MKLVPTALTCTPWRATSSATFRVSIVAPARAEEYSGAPGVGRAAEALVITRICPSPRSTMGSTIALRNWYGASTQLRSTERRSSTVEFTNRPVTMIPENATAESMRPNRSSAAFASFGAASGSARSNTRGTASTAAPIPSSSATRSSVGSPTTRSWPRRASSRQSDGPT